MRFRRDLKIQTLGSQRVATQVELLFRADVNSRRVIAALIPAVYLQVFNSFVAHPGPGTSPRSYSVSVPFFITHFTGFLV